MAEPNGHDRAAVLPRRVGKLAHLVDILREEGRAVGWSAARDVLLERYELFKSDMPPALIIKLAIDCDRHALFSEMASDKSRAHSDQDAYAWFQSYLRGEREDAPSAQVGATSALVPAALPQDTEDDEEAHDGEGPDARR